MFHFDLRTLLFNVRQVFRDKYRLGYVLATLLNAAISIFMASFTVFVVRQLVLTIVIGFFCFFNEEMVSARRDLSQVQETLEGHNRIFRYDLPLLFLSPVAGFICIINMTNEIPKGLLYLSVVYLTFFLFYSVYRWFCICTLPAARSAFTRRPLPVGAATGRRYVSQYIAAGIKMLPETGRIIGLVGNLASLAAGHSALHKITYGYHSRPPVFNFISYCRVGLTCPSDIGYGLGIALVTSVEAHDPELRAQITEPNSYGQINGKEALKYIRENAGRDDAIGQAIRGDHELLEIAKKAQEFIDDHTKKIS